MDDRITLDRESFRSLASGTRVDILKSLDRRRKMLSELSRHFGMSPSTIKEHMDNLTRAGLVVQIDDGHKWKYYELTPKAREILRPEGTKIYIILGLSLFALLFTAWDLLRLGMAYSASLAGQAGNLMETGRDALTESAPASAPQAFWPAMPYVHIAGIALFAAMLGVSLGYIISRKTGPPLLE